MSLQPYKKSAHLASAGFTLIEVLVVCFVIGLLIALLLPSVQSARESARRLQCTANLKQIGIAIQGYTSLHNVLPRGAKSYSLFSSILPDLDQPQLFNSINFSLDRPMPDARCANSTVAASTISVLVCPSDSVTSRRGGGSSYGGNRGVGFTQFEVMNNGPFAVALGVPIVGPQNVTDGMSRTAAVAEFLGGVYQSRDPLQAVFKIRDQIVGDDVFYQFLRLCETVDVTSAELGDEKGREWIGHELGQTLYNHAMRPNGYTCTSVFGTRSGAWTAGSQHGVGANVLYLDGHVEMTHEEITLQIWRALGTMNKQEVIGDF
jgi:prepilin-type processing-associated H-X9-DG protein/prepilin-type N-terminal cleavage/methylation domain-containing protein